MDLSEAIREQAAALGFVAVGIAPAVPSPAGQAAADWVAAGHHGTMGWFERHVPAKGDPRAYWPEARSVVVVALPYLQPAPPEAAAGQGRFSRYAWGRDYHKVIRKRLERLLAALQAQWPGLQGKLCVDTAPLAEKDLAQRAGIGWIGKHGNVIRLGAGSWFFLGELLLDVDLPPDTPATAHCGTCTRCLDACPTQAIVSPGHVDARRCISYLTIEHRDTVDPALRPGMGTWVYGCDICQEVCPHNRFAAPGDTEFAVRHNLNAPSLLDLLQLTDETFLERFAGTPVMRTKRRGLVRNAAIALGNARPSEALPDLIARLGDGEPVVREHAAWAVGRYEEPAALQALTLALAGEDDPIVRAALASAIADWQARQDPLPPATDAASAGSTPTPAT
jgi:epoxyqueuosine reductase